MVNSYSSKEEQKDSADEINIADLLKIFIRRKKIFALTAVSVFLASTGYAVWQRINSPVFKGSFVLLIDDPTQSGSINSKNNGIGSSLSLLEGVALNKSSNDIPTLISFLKSPILLEETTTKFQLNPSMLAKSLKISTDTVARKEAKGILNIFFDYKDPVKGKEILDFLSQSYLKSSIKQSQLRLQAGLDFLNTQAPSLQKKYFDLADELEKFRENNVMLEPFIEGGKLKAENSFPNQGKTFVLTKKHNAG